MMGLHTLPCRVPMLWPVFADSGAWSQAVIAVELRKDYQEYPFWDKSGEAMQRRFGIDLSIIAGKDRALAADLYVYGASLMESQT